MRRLCATKTKLYQLVAKFEPLPPMRKTTFTKAFRQPDYFLRWADREGLLCVAYFAAFMGKPRLVVARQKPFGELVSRVVFGLDIDDIKQRGMVEEFMTAAERKWEGEYG